MLLAGRYLVSHTADQTAGKWLAVSPPLSTPAIRAEAGPVCNGRAGASALTVPRVDRGPNLNGEVEESEWAKADVLVAKAGSLCRVHTVVGNSGVVQSPQRMNGDVHRFGCQHRYRRT
jgi:hypothetical protein